MSGLWAKHIMSTICAENDNFFHVDNTVGRFAPSPTGRIHAGNIFAALLSWLYVKSRGGEIVLRIEDLDEERSKSQYADMVQRDFETLGLTWDRGPYFQQNRTEAYRVAYEQIKEKGRIYPCFCTRADLRVLSAPHFGEKTVYPGLCKNLSETEQQTRLDKLRRQTNDPTRLPAMRLEVESCRIEFDDIFQGHYGQQLEKDCGDFILRRTDGAFAYQLAVVVDDAEQGINTVIRGIDLLSSTPQQIYLQNLLSYSQPTYAHFPLFIAPDNKRLAKRNRYAQIDALLDTFKTPEGVIGHIAYKGGLISVDEPTTPEELLACYDLEKLIEQYRSNISILYEP